MLASTLWCKNIKQMLFTYLYFLFSVLFFSKIGTYFLQNSQVTNFYREQHSLVRPAIRVKQFQYEWPTLESFS